MGKNGATNCPPPLDLTPLIDQVCRNNDQANLLLKDVRIVACFGSRALLVAFLGWTANHASVVGAATTEAEALQLVETHQPQMVLLSDRLEQGNGISLVQRIKGRWPQMHTILLICQEQRQHQIKAAIDACCDGILLESKLGLGMGVAALNAVGGGGIFIDKSLQEIFRRGHEHGAPIEPLTARELEVLALVAKGKGNSKIGSELYISADTVKTHLSNVMRKLQAQDRTQAAVIGLRWGLIDWPEMDWPR
ncbi:response regulator transcription factor [Cyanobium sp. WAJ14-Wanaka]|uniref:response regulator transcription factor n=1 Tax=Cyanobium sp. WAJ14-Wanaka TaxID=2823725 RepID=UPI0020CD4BDF|nr:response regulator transcription factor [Cyanobium sp. WAJ14-Wanaka]MCP9775157.1 response regulator transcription factor [Cyanobium sp. WAJ14-Wanaka]